MKIALMCLLTLLSFIPGIAMRYVPFASLLTPRQKKLAILVYGSFTLAYIAAMGLMARFWGVSAMWLKFCSVIFGILSASLNLLLIPGRVQEHIFAWGLSSTLNNMLLSIADYAISRINGLDQIQNHTCDCALLLILFLLFCPLIYKLLRKTITPFLSVDVGSYWNTTFLIPGMLYLSAITTLPLDIHADSLYPLISRILLNIATVMICLSIATDHDRMRHQQETDRQLRLQSEYYEELAQQVAQARKTRHDFKHHIAAIQGYIDANVRDGLQEYCRKFQQTNTPSVLIPYSGNAAADGVLYHSMLKAAQDNIHFDLIGIIHSKGIEDIDLCVLLGNALDNALEGCMTVDRDRSISVIAEAEAQVLSIVVHNSFDGNVVKGDSGIHSRKREYSRPGVGLASMEAICLKYGGYMDISYDEHTFTLLISLPLKKTE